MLNRYIIIASCFFLLKAVAKDSSDGCGVGNLIYGKKTLVGTSIRYTTNAFIGIVNLGATTSGTSGCARHSIVQAEKRSIHYVESNAPYILSAVANGSGEYVAGLTRVMGCEESVTRHLGIHLKKNFSRLAPHSETPIELLGELKEVILEDQLLRNHCQVNQWSA